MLMNFSSKRKAVHATPVFLPGRTGHRAARINDSIFVLGGTDKAGGFVSEVHRINCLNNKIDTLILENTISVEGFSLFSYQEALFLWGGRRLTQHVNLLLQFDGVKFATLKQHGNVPAPRAFHASVTFGGKYLILFGGSDQFTFFNDWNLLNLKTLEWKTLKPSLEVKPSLHSSMMWTNGRGILLLNQIFQPTSASNLPNAFYEFYVSDFNSGRLKLLPLQLAFTNTFFQQYIFRHMAVSQQNSVLIFGGYQLNDPSSLHNHSYVLSLDPVKLEKSKLRYKEKSQFVNVYHKNKLFIIGGILNTQQLESYLEIYENTTDRSHYRRHVCQTCKLYYDEEWFKTSRQAFPHCRVKQQYDYNSHPKMDNRILAKFSTYITNQVYAVSLIIQSLKKMTSSIVQITFHKQKQDYSRMIQEMTDETHYFLKIVSNFSNFDHNLVINQLLMSRQREYQDSSSSVIPQLELLILKIKLACLRLGSSTLFSLKVNKDQIFIIYFSCSQLQCTHSNMNPFTNYHYYYNTKTKECSSRNNRHIIIENLKRHNYTSLAQFQQTSNHSLTMLIFCREYLQNEFVIMQNHEQMETGQTCPVLMSKEQNRKAVSLFQFSFLPQPKLSNIFLQQNPVNFINILEILKGDFNSKTLERINLFDHLMSGEIFQRIEIFYYPQEYWFRRMLIYHSNRLIIDFQGKLNVCGVITLKPAVELDLTGNRISSLQVEQKVRDVMRELRSLKRQVSTF